MRKPVSVKMIHGYPVFVRDGTPDEMVANECLGREFLTLCELLKNVRRDNIVLDIGGYIGTAAVKFSTCVPRSRVITIEPSPDNYAILNMNASTYSNIYPINSAAGVTAGKMTLMSRGTGEWGYTLIANPKDSKSPIEMSTVDVITIEQAIKSFNFEDLPISMAKIDIEGGEVELLRQAPWIENTAIIVAELHERIVTGCIDAWNMIANMNGRISIKPDGEKRISINPFLLQKLCR